MHKFLTHAAVGLACSAVVRSLSFGWGQPNSASYETSELAQNTVVALLAVSVLVLALFQRRTSSIERSRPRTATRSMQQPQIGD